MRTTRTSERTIIKCLTVFAILVLAMLVLNSRANAEAMDYLTDNYSGTVTRDDGADIYTAPGTSNDKVQKNDGTELHLASGTEILITGEEYDADLDVWYKCQVTVDGVTYEGYAYTGRVTRGTAIAHTPTPTPSPTPTPAEIATDGLPGPEFTPAGEQVDQSTQDMIDDSNTFKPWKWIIILVIVILLFMIIYTAWVKASEDKLEREIERYSNRPQYEPLEGELEEDFAEAKASYYDHIGLGNQTNRNLAEVIGNPEDVQLDMTGIFDDNERTGKSEDEMAGERFSYTDNGSLKDLIASLEERIGNTDPYGDEKADEVVESIFEEVTKGGSPIMEDNDAFETQFKPDEDDDSVETEENEADADDGSDDEVSADKEESTANSVTDETEGEKPAAETAQETVIPEFVKRAGSNRGVVPSPSPVPAQKEPATDYQVEGLAALFEEPEEDEDAAFDLRDMLDNLSEGDTLIHRSYGEGVVEDNTDAQVIQVRFGDDVRYLKKEKLVKKNLIQL